MEREREKKKSAIFERKFTSYLFFSPTIYEHHKLLWAIPEQNREEYLQIQQKKKKKLFIPRTENIHQAWTLDGCLLTVGGRQMYCLFDTQCHSFHALPVLFSTSVGII